jgi:sugar phosphate isomerase/epimerase
MVSPLTTRRQFIQTAAIAAAATTAPRNIFAAAQTTAPAWTIGCLNRPWVKWKLDEMLDGVKAAGYRTVGLQTNTTGEAFIAAGATPAYLESLKQKIAARGLKVNLARLTLKDGAPQAEASASIRQQLDNARTLGVGTLINTGTGKPEHYEGWYRSMAYAAAYGADLGIQIVMKPHGGVVAASAELLTSLEKINHRNLGIWYDAGNVIFYTGKDPLAELEPIISRVTAFTAKDCASKGSDVMIQFGDGKVDFKAIFQRLKRAGFKGPIMVESCAIKDTAAGTTANAKANRVFLEKALAAI